MERCILTEMERENVLVVADSNDGLQDENTRACNDSVLRAEVGMLPQNAIVLFVAAHHIRHLDWVTRGIVVICVEVFDGACHGDGQLELSKHSHFEAYSPKQSHPSRRLFALSPAPSLPKSNAALRG